MCLLTSVIIICIAVAACSGELNGKPALDQPEQISSEIVTPTQGAESDTIDNNEVINTNDFVTDDLIGEFEFRRPYPEIPDLTEGVSVELMSDGIFILRVWRGTELGLMKGEYELVNGQLAFAVTHMNDAHGGGWEDIDSYLDDGDFPVEHIERMNREIRTTLSRDNSYIRIIDKDNLVFRHVTEDGFELFSDGELILVRQ